MIEVPQSAIGLDGAIGLTLLNSLNQSDRVLWTGGRFTHLCSGSDRSPQSAIGFDWAIALFTHTAIEVLKVRLGLIGRFPYPPHRDRVFSKCDRA